jgi:tRNA threonylcarbamoyladenosine biosynthesis protein TsaB
VTTIVGFDTATADAAVAVTSAGEVIWETRRGPNPGSTRPAHATALLGEVERAVAAAGGWDRVDRIAVGLGPGSFTGLRIGIAAARALATARGLALVGVGTLAAIAAGIRELAPGRLALPVLDARRGEAFAALYGAGGDELWAPLVATPAELGDRVAAAPAAPLAAGDGSLRFRRRLEDSGALVADAGEDVHRVAARHLCRLGEEAAPAPFERVQPIYLRRPDAETWRERQRARPGG